jgi:hypothetical protein
MALGIALGVQIHQRNAINQYIESHLFSITLNHAAIGGFVELSPSPAFL